MVMIEAPRYSLSVNLTNHINFASDTDFFPSFWFFFILTRSIYNVIRWKPVPLIIFAKYADLDYHRAI